jgi:hypothetical protein
MKKLMLPIMLILAYHSVTYAQKRNCGTMDNLELRKKKTPALILKMAEDEKRLNTWIMSHHATKASVISLPRLPHFHATGNAEIDLANYALAKESYLKSTGTYVLQNETDQVLMTKLKDQKRKNNSFTNKP